MTNEEMVRRVAARSLRADDQQQLPPDGQQSQLQQQALPKSGPGQMMLQKALGELTEAIESGDDAGFDAAIDNLIKAKGTRKPGAV